MDQSNTNNTLQIGKLALALSKAQGQMGFALKSETNPFFKSSYADLASVWDAIRKPLADNELAIIQNATTRIDGFITVTTTLAHSSGEYISSDLTMKPIKPDPQSLGSCITYARRYALAAIVGVAQADDDGNSASHATTPPGLQSTKSISMSQVTELQQLVIDSGTDTRKFLQAFSCSSYTNLTTEQYNQAKLLLEKKIKAKKTEEFKNEVVSKKEEVQDE